LVFLLVVKCPELYQKLLLKSRVVRAIFFLLSSHRNQFYQNNRPKERSKESDENERHIDLDETLDFVIADEAETYQPAN